MIIEITSENVALFCIIWLAFLATIGVWLKMWQLFGMPNK